MNRLLIPFILFLSLFLSSCEDNDAPESSPIRFGKTDYTIRFGIATHISFVDGGGEYELTASNTDVLGEFYIDTENQALVVNPSGVGESKLTITDVRNKSSVTLNITVEDFYLACRIVDIEGENLNPYLSIGNEIRFIRDMDNNKSVKIMWQNKVTYELKCIANGRFDIERSETNIFTLNMALHSDRIEELEAFSYTMGGDGECLDIFDKYFDYNWGNSIASRSLPVKQIRMILTDPITGCKISCSLQPL